MELIQVGEKTYYIKNATNIGIYNIRDNDVYIIDSGGDKDTGKKVLKIVNEQGWNIIGIINTHSNADHIGGNQVIQNRTNCEILSYGMERPFIEYPILESTFLYGGYPFKDLTNKFLLAKESKVTSLENHLPHGLTYLSLKGHFMDMIGIHTDDNVYFLADSLFSEETIQKYHIFFIYDVEQFLTTLDFLSQLQGKLYIPSHHEAVEDITHLIEVNRAKVYEIMDKIVLFCKEKLSFEELLKKIFDDYCLEMNANQYVLVGSTIRSYLSYLYNHEQLTYEFQENKMIWKTIEKN